MSIIGKGVSPVLRIVLSLLMMSALVFMLISAEQTTPQTPDELTTLRNLGKAYYENDEFDKAAQALQKCLAMVPDSAPDHINLGLTLLRAKQYDEAIAHLEEAERIEPGYLHIYYDLGIIYKRLGEYQKAAGYLEQVKKENPTSAAVRYNLGDVYKKMGDDEKALAEFRETVRLDPKHVSAHYQLLMYAKKQRRKGEADREAEIFGRLKKETAEAERTPEALERSTYSYFIDVSPLKSLPSRQELTGQMRFRDGTSRSKLKKGPGISIRGGLEMPLKASTYDPAVAHTYWASQLGGEVVFGDYNNDSHLDVYIIACDPDTNFSANCLYRNNGDGTFVDVTAEAGVGDRGMGTDAIFGDYDNDGFLDLYVVNAGPNVLYHNNGDSTYTDVSVNAGVDEPQFGLKAVWVDYDHDNDLDIFVVNFCDLYHPPEQEAFFFPTDFDGQTNALLRNNGDGTFDDFTDEAGLLIDVSKSRDVFISDLDDDHDIDIYVANEETPNILFLNKRGGEFEGGGIFDETESRGCLSAAEGDFNNDGYPDLFLVTDQECFIYQNDGQAHFQKRPLPELTGPMKGQAGPAEVLDFNNDGLTDIVIVGTGEQRPFLFLNTGSGGFSEVSSVLDDHDGRFKRLTSLAAGDYDSDGDVDIIALTERNDPLLLNNEGGNANNWIEVLAEGMKVNRSAIGSKIEIKAGPYYQRKTLHRQPLHFGLGDIGELDIVRITWPNGVVQNAVKVQTNKLVTVEEKVRVSASCGFLYTYDGHQFVFINEILGIGPLGVPMAEGVYHAPDCDEFMKIEGHLLKPKDGLYDIRLTEALRELTFADQIQLLVVDHPSDVDMYPNEMFTAPPFPEHKLFAVRDRFPPRSAIDHRGRDILPLIVNRDQRYPTFKRLSYDGLAEVHWLTLDLGDLSGAEQIMLYLTGWIYWANSSVVIAVSQNPQFEFIGPYLQVKNERGEWVTVLDQVGLPTSKELTIPVDLTHRFITTDYTVRIVTNLCLYWDQIFVATDDHADELRITEMLPVEADLQYRGFPEMTRDSLGFEIWDYDPVQRAGPWGQHRGWYTRYGDVQELLLVADDKYVIFGPGDELALRFDATQAPRLPAGYTRDFIFYANGWVKDGDLNTRHSLTVEPLPFHGMSGYPYGEDESYPYDADHRTYIETYNTRKEADTVGRLHE